MKSARGQLVVLLLLLLPLCITIVVGLADMALVIVTKMRLQTTADRAARAAGKNLAELMQQLAHTNWQIHHEFTQQQKEFTTSQEQSVQSGKDHIHKRQLAIDFLRAQMDETLHTGYTQACQRALAVVVQEFPWAEMVPLYGGARMVTQTDGRSCVADRPLFSFYDDAVRTEQWPTLAFTYPKGDSAYDPADVDQSDRALLQYRTKAEGDDQQVAFALRLRSRLPRGFFGGLFTDRVAPGELPRNTAWLEASAAAQPIGGSIEAAAFLNADSEADLDAEIHEAGLSYDTTLVPLDRLQQRNAGYQGLRYFDDTNGWIDDDAWYLQ